MSWRISSLKDITWLRSTPSGFQLVVQSTPPKKTVDWCNLEVQTRFVQNLPRVYMCQLDAAYTMNEVSSKEGAAEIVGVGNNYNSPPPLLHQQQQQQHHHHHSPPLTTTEPQSNNKGENKADNRISSSQALQVSTQKNSLKESQLDSIATGRRGNREDLYEKTEKQRPTTSKRKPRKTMNSKKCSFFFSPKGCAKREGCRFSHAATQPTSTVNRQEGEDQTSVPSELPGTDDNQERTMCRLFFSATGCAEGDACKFSHLIPGEKMPDSSEQSLLMDENKTTQTVAPAEKIVVCKYFFSLKGCAKGNACKFSHIAVPVETTFKSKPTLKPVCKFFAAGHCRWGDKCGFSHGDQAQNISRATTVCKAASGSAQQKPLSQMTDPELKKCRQTEINQLRRRYPRRKEIESTFIILFKCSDPDWAFDVKTISLSIVFPPLYPRECMVVTIHEPGAMPGVLASYVGRKVTDWIVEKHAESSRKDECNLIFRPFLRWLDRTAESLFTDGLMMYKRELIAEAAGLKFVHHEDLAPQPPSTDASESDASENSGNGDGGDNDLEGMMDLSLEPNQGNRDVGTKEMPISTDIKNKTHDDRRLNPVRKGTELKLRGLQLLENAATLYCTTIRTGLKCKRCKTVHHIKMHAERPYVVVCDKCRSKMVLIYHAALMHSQSNTMGFFDLDGCTPFDLILPDCQAVSACLECNKEMPVHGLQSDQSKQFWCLSCHSKMVLQMEKGSFVLLNQGTGLKVGADAVLIAKKARVKTDLQILAAGKPLPEDGTCKHYKKSYRWFRFPCCGKLYPCDLCHNDKEHDHEMELANRMVCGFCSKEQGFSMEKPCVQCGSSMTRANSSHWEGGKGCRNKLAMAKGDKQKFSGVNKTVSNKAAEAQKKSGKKTTKLRHS